MENGKRFEENIIIIPKPVIKVEKLRKWVLLGHKQKCQSLWKKKLWEVCYKFWRTEYESREILASNVSFWKSIRHVKKKKVFTECSHGDGVSRRGCIVDILGSIECNLHTLNYCRMGLQNLI